MFDIDVKGAKNIKEYYKDQCLSIFIRPPSLAELIQRLKNRSTESEESLNKRIKRVTKEMTYENYFDAVIVNDLLEVAFIEAEHLIENFIFGKLVSDEDLSNLK